MKPLAVYDLESTSADVGIAKIVQLALVPIGNEQDTLNLLVNPGCPIPAEATEVHGITDEAVADAPFFLGVAEQVQEVVSNVLLVGYNCRSFDAPLLDRELQDAGQPGLGLDTLEEIDVFRLWKELEPRTLVGAAERFLDPGSWKFHDAADDCRVTAAVLDKVRRKWGGLGEPLSVEKCLALSKPSWEVDRDGKLRREDDRRIVFSFGKHKGKSAQEHRGYLRWMLSSNFSASTKAAIRKLLAAGRC